jgi:monoterpene epsilon-lactone hydrolase
VCLFNIGYSGFECHISQLFNLSVLHIEYRLCPEHPVPAAVEDGVALYHALLNENISSSQLLFMGDSAGGGLSLLTIQALMAHQLPLPRGVIVLSPWTDLSASGESYKRNRQLDVMFRNTKEDDGATVKLMLGSSQLPPDNPIYSPLFGSFEGFPPMYVTVGTAEILEDDSRGIVKKAEEAGINVTFEIGLHLMHVYPLFFPYYPEARTSLNNMNKWIQTLFT